MYNRKIQVKFNIGDVGVKVKVAKTKNNKEKTYLGP